MNERDITPSPASGLSFNRVHEHGNMPDPASGSFLTVCLSAMVECSMSPKGKGFMMDCAADFMGGVVLMFTHETNRAKQTMYTSAHI